MSERIIVISGFSGVGKGTLVRQLFEFEKTAKMDSRLWLSVSDTTRPPRSSGGDNYNYISFTEYRKRVMNGFYLEHNEYGNHGYGTPIKPVLAALECGNVVVLEIDYNGMLQVREYFCDRGVPVRTIFICTEADELATRLHNRGDSPSEFRKRLSAACSEAGHVQEYDCVVNNDILDRAAHTLWTIVTEEDNSIIDNFDSSRFCAQAASILESCDIFWSTEEE